MNDNEEQPSERQARIDGEAGLWCARMDGENAGGYRHEFEAWLAASPDHSQAYEKALNANRNCMLVSTLAGYGVDRDRARELELARRAFHKPPFWATKGALAASLVLGAGLGAGLYFRQVAESQTRQETAKTLLLMTRLGEIRTFRLADGSSLTLDTNSRVEISIGAHSRRLHLLAGRSRLQVAIAPYPFEIDAGAARLLASPGIFDIGMTANRDISLRSLSGIAELRAIDPADLSPTTIQTVESGQTFSISRDRFDPTVQSTSSFNSADWPGGWLECKDIALNKLVEMASQYSPRPIVLDAPDAGQIEVRGRFRIADTDAFVRNIAEQYDLNLTQNSHEIRLRGK
jgi:transmembrane sensor